MKQHMDKNLINIIGGAVILLMGLIITFLIYLPVGIITIITGVVILTGGLVRKLKGGGGKK